MKPHPAPPDELAALARALADLHGAHGRHRRSVHVCERFRGQVVWEGDVEVFDLDDCDAPRAYAWAHETDTGGRRYVTVLHKPPVTSPETAVRAAIVQEHRTARR